MASTRITRKVKVEDYSSHPLDEFFTEDDAEEATSKSVKQTSDELTSNELTSGDAVELPSTQDPGMTTTPGQPMTPSRDSSSEAGSVIHVTPTPAGQGSFKAPYPVQTPQRGSTFKYLYSDDSDWSTPETPLAGYKLHDAFNSGISTPSGSSYLALGSRLQSRHGLFSTGPNLSMTGPNLSATEPNPSTASPGGVATVPFKPTGQGMYSDNIYRSLHPLHQQFLNVEQVAHAEHLARSGMEDVLFMINDSELIKFDKENAFKAYSYATIEEVNGVQGWYKHDGSLLAMSTTACLNVLEDLNKQKQKRGIPLPHVNYNDLRRR
ncbi:hypothetical protein GGR53DRAFT_465742 [Hypoxylon sp. FL1150]|nr:hypothetical protein GGR53DRAFT_465742 [Hypoxylon sp. FL1150]